MENVGESWSVRRNASRARTEILQGKKLPETLRRATIPFAEIADDAIAYIKGGYARPADDVARMEVLKGWFTGRSAESINPQEVEAALEEAEEENDWGSSTVNHHHTLLSLTYRLAIRNAKVKQSAVRGIRRRAEDNSRVRFLTADEEKRLREALRSKAEWAEHEPELDLALHTGLRRTDMYQRLVWENVNYELRVATVPRSKNDDPVHVPLNDDAMRALRAFRLRGDGTGRVVRNEAGETLTVNAHWFPDALRAAGIKLSLARLPTHFRQPFAAGWHPARKHRRTARPQDAGDVEKVCTPVDR
jgi:hypothetical protein